MLEEQIEQIEDIFTGAENVEELLEDYKYHCNYTDAEASQAVEAVINY